MTEQDASDAATLTVSSGRALVAGESLVARITLATSTMARLPGHATPDFAVTATGTGVVLTGAATTHSAGHVHRLRRRHRADRDGDAHSDGC